MSNLSKEEKEKIRDRIDELKYFQNKVTQIIIFLSATMIPFIILFTTQIINKSETEILENQTKIILYLICLAASVIMFGMIIARLGTKQRIVDKILKNNYDLLLDRK